MNYNKKIGLLGAFLLLVNTIVFFLFQERIISFLLNAITALYLFSYYFKDIYRKE